MSFSIHTLTTTPFQQNCRILAAADLSCVVIDPGGEVDVILDAVNTHKLHVSSIWLTHSHIDHCGGVAELKERTHATLYGHKIETEFRAHVLDVAKMYGLPTNNIDNCPEPDIYLSGGEKLTFADTEFSVLFTPGHAPGHLCYYNAADGVLIAGDTLFKGSIGRTDLPGGDYQTLIESIKQKLLALPDATKVLSGHGPDTTIGEEKKHNPFLE